VRRALPLQARDEILTPVRSSRKVWHRPSLRELHAPVVYTAVIVDGQLAIIEHGKHDDAS